jgi:outer membrane protein assembly factor BamE (lipoprotein component of BamABCDE complex)
MAGSGSGRDGARRTMGRLGIGMILALTLAACAAVYRNHGYVPVEEDLALVEVGVDTRETLAPKIGRPSAQGLLNDVGWFYVQSRFRHYGPYAPEEIDRQVVAVTFSDAGTVENIARFGLEEGRVVELSRRVTRSNVRGLSFIGQLFGNIGTGIARSALQE